MYMSESIQNTSSKDNLMVYKLKIIVDWPNISADTVIMHVIN